ncbi:STE-domain-containing protein, partial [Ramicandelaber brevisporus]
MLHARFIDLKPRGGENILQALRRYLKVAPSMCTGDINMIRFHLSPTDDTVHCVRWEDRFYITAFDIAKILSFRPVIPLMRRQILNRRKFLETLFSNLRTLRVGHGCVQVDAAETFMDFLATNKCLRYRKKQKVYYWEKVSHDGLLLEALDRQNRR